MGSASGQPAGKATRFDTADVRSSPRTTLPVVRGPFYSSGSYELRFANMLDLIRIAYDLDPEKIYGGPNWLEMDRYDVFAQAPAGSSVESRRLMLQELLAERFHLTTHKDTKPMAAYALMAGKHPLLKEADGAGESGCNFSVPNAPQAPPQNGAPIQLPVFTYACKNTTMATLAAAMLGIPGSQQYFNNRPVVDQTELKGAYDFTLRFTPKLPAALATTGEAIPLFDAVEKQLGLKLEASNAPLPVIVVDGVNRKPANPPDVEKKSPVAPTEFEVAEIKLSPPDATGPQQPTIKNGRVHLPGFTLKTLVQVAWELNSDEMLSGMPKWFDEDKFDVLAKTPNGVAMGDLTPQQRNVIPVNIDALRPMLRTLIIERFKLVSHTEERPLNAYTLVAAKPKLKKGDPASRTKWQEGTDPGSKDNKNANATLGRLVTCQNVTMAQFAELLPRIAPGYLRTEVIDATGLEGGWDFTFSFSPAGLLQIAPGRTADDGSGEASEPSGGLSLFDAMTKQLGLKLEQHKRPYPVLVIDSVERKPIDN